MKKTVFFMLAVVISYFAATWKLGDSAHSIGIIKAQGGSAKHASVLASGKNGYTLVATATVIPPYRGDARVTLEGKPEIPCEIYMSRPALDFGFRRNPKLVGDTIYGLKPRDRVALWVVMRPPKVDPVCGMAEGPGFLNYNWTGKDYIFCSRGCRESFLRAPADYKGKDGIRGDYNLVFTDVRSGAQVLKAPLTFKGKGGGKDECERH